MSIWKKMFAVVFICMALFTGFACETDEGPMEEMGESVDESMEEAGDEMEEATD